jgi:HEAT repeat protein
MGTETMKMMNGMRMALLAAALVVGNVGAQVSAERFAQAPEPWLQEDPGSRVYASARGALNGGRYHEAAEQFGELREQFPGSGYVADSYYYQAFALSRLGGRAELRQAIELLRVQAEQYPDAASRGDARELTVRVEAQLARRGDAQAAAAIAQQASDPCGEEQQAVQAAALSALLNMNPERAVPLLREVLQSRDECSVELRRQAVFLMAQKMDEESVDLLLDLAHRNPDPDPEVREQAVFWLSQVKSPEALNALDGLLRESDDPEIQENALFAISQHQSPRAVEILRLYAERSDLSAEQKENALFFIGQSEGGTEYLMQLYDALQDAELKEQALFGISQRNTDANRRWMVDRAMDPSEDVEVRENALFLAGQMGGFSTSELRELYGSFDNLELREQVIFVASQRSGTEVVDFLMEIAQNEEDPELREGAIFWLGQSDDPRVPEFLLGLIRR